MSASQGDLRDSRGSGGAHPPAGFLAWWRRRSAARRANLEARHLLKEARRILRKRGPQIPGAVTATVNAAIKGVTDAMEAGDVERLRKANLTLDETMDDHLSFARKSTLREYAESIVIATLWRLSKAGVIPTTDVQKAIEELGVHPDKQNPLYA